MYNEYNVLKIIYIYKVMKMNDYNMCGCVVLMGFWKLLLYFCLLE